MSAAPPRTAALRVGAIALVAAGLSFHLWLGSRLPLLAVVAGLGCHLVAAAAGRRRQRHRTAQAPGG